MLKKPLQQEHIEENTNFLISSFPVDLDMEDPVIKELGLYYLPYSTGFEIECYMDSTDNSDIMSYRKIFSNIPNILEADINSGDEQRFRIPKGIEGLVCLFHISENLKKYAYPNPLSGIHYHVDCTSWYNDRIDDNFLLIYSDYILSELDKWEFKGTYNTRRVGPGASWCRCQSYFKTIEIRCGEMTFDYPLLFKRITHANQIVANLKAKSTPIRELYSKNTVNIIKNRKIQL